MRRVALRLTHSGSTVLSMMRRFSIPAIAITVALAFAFSAPCSAAQAPASANAAFDTYVRTVEARIAGQHASAGRFIVLPSPSSEGDAAPLIERIAVASVPGGLVHHWRASQFLPGVRAAELERLLRNYSAYPTLFAPQVERARAVPTAQGVERLSMRVRQHHVITVVLDTDYEVSFGQLDPQHRYSTSRSTGVRELDSPGTRAEHTLPPDKEHGFLWRQNTYWSYEERDGGLYVQVESVSLTRSIPTGLGWAIGPYIESIPRDSLAFTLQCICSALQRQPRAWSSTYNPQSH
jgi:hypothetical protein